MLQRTLVPMRCEGCESTGISLAGDGGSVHTGLHGD